MYGLKLQLNDYPSAQNVLNNLPKATQNEQWFKGVQEINLDRLQSP